MLQLNMDAIASHTGVSPDEIIERFGIGRGVPPSARQVTTLVIWSGLPVQVIVSVVT